MSDPVKLAIIQVFGTAIGLVITGVMAYFMAKIQAQGKEAAVQAKEVAEVAKDAAAKVEDVKTNLEKTSGETSDKLEKLGKVAHDTHVLVNANMGAQLKISSVALRRLAEMTKNPEDGKAAEVAEALLTEHEKKQAIVDLGQTKMTVQVESK